MDEFEHFKKNLYPKPICTNDLADGVKHRKREDAICYRYLGLNRSYRAYLAFDLDFPSSAFAWEDLRLPPPSLVIGNPANCHSHYLYRLRTPVIFTDGGRLRPQQYFRAIQRTLTKLLGADEAYRGLIVKNPLHHKWRVLKFSVEYDLEDFQEWFELLPEKIAAPDLDMYLGRNDALFRILAKWAHERYGRATGLDNFMALVRCQADQINATFPKPLATNEVRDTALSVARGVWRWRQANPPSSLRPATKARIQAAADELKGAGRKVTQLALSLRSGIPQKTINKYLGQIER